MTGAQRPSEPLGRSKGSLRVEREIHASTPLGGTSDGRTHPRLRVICMLPSLGAGGSERVLLTVLRHLDRERFEATLVVVDGRHTDLAHDVPSDIPVFDLGCARVRQAPARILKLLWQRRPAVVLSTLGHLNLMLALLKPLLPRSTRLVGRESNVPSALFALTGASRWWNAAYRLFYSRLDYVICQSKAMQVDLEDSYSVRAPMRVIPNPVDVARIRELSASLPSHAFFEGSGVVRLVAVGRLERQKGFDILLDALAMLARADVRLAIVGEGSLRPELVAQAERLGLASRTLFAGRQQNPYAWMRSADALVLPSRLEGFPNVVLEALACGTPVVATPVPGTMEILGGLPGCAVSASVSAGDLAAALAQWLASPRIRLGREAASPYEAAEITRRYEKVLNDAAVI